VTTGYPHITPGSSRGAHDSLQLKGSGVHYLKCAGLTRYRGLPRANVTDVYNQCNFKLTRMMISAIIAEIIVMNFYCSETEKHDKTDQFDSQVGLGDTAKQSRT
jgi:hypothetical protein